MLPASKLEGGRALPHFDTSLWLELERSWIGVDLPRDPSTPTLLRYPSDWVLSFSAFLFEVYVQICGQQIRVKLHGVPPVCLSGVDISNIWQPGE